MKIKLIILIITGLILINFVNAAVGVGYPYPSQLELKPGESGRFQFEIQTTPEEGDVTCTYNLENPIPLIINFDEQSIPITPTGQTIRMPVYATVTVPIEAESGSYSTSFCVTCAPKDEGNPVGALGAYCGITFGVNVVGERTRENPYVPPKPAKTNAFILTIIFTLIAILVLVFIYITKRVLKR
ncbi:hypothetical protein J4427_01540 [Candidatus Woesearchaeota archaeon]|nr:hypothetical protein [Candidatus Woesearchaeota archaeon]